MVNIVESRIFAKNFQKKKMELKQKQGYVYRYNDVIKEHHSDLFFPNTRGELNISNLYRLLFGYDSRYEFRLILDEKQRKYNLVPNIVSSATEHSVNDESFNDTNLTSFSFYDTCKNMGIQCFPYVDKAIFIEDGLIVCLERDEWIDKVDTVDNTILCYAKDDRYCKAVEEFVNKCIVEVDNKSDNRPNTYNLVSYGYDGFFSNSYQFDNWNSNIGDNYNVDLPYERICGLLKSDKPEFILFSGSPGTGKTSLIKSLINDLCKEKDFYLIDNIAKGEFIDFLVHISNSVIIMEDCEKALMDRDVGNSIIDTILNLTDGIIGETFKLKFLCTINCPESKIDKALLRKGRLSLKYQFKELSIDKCKKIWPDASKPMTLADLYNYKIDNGNTTVEKKIGFVQ